MGSAGSRGVATIAFPGRHANLSPQLSTEPQVFPHEAEARQGAEAEPPDPAMDSSADRQHHPVRRTARSFCPIAYLASLPPAGHGRDFEWRLAGRAGPLCQPALPWPAPRVNGMDRTRPLTICVFWETTATTLSGGTGARPASASKRSLSLNMSQSMVSLVLPTSFYNAHHWFAIGSPAAPRRKLSFGGNRWLLRP